MNVAQATNSGGNIHFGARLINGANVAVFDAWIAASTNSSGIPMSGVATASGIPANSYTIVPTFMNNVGGTVTLPRYNEVQITVLEMKK